jgi:hypothetical protein
MEKPRHADAGFDRGSRADAVQSCGAADRERRAPPYFSAATCSYASHVLIKTANALEIEVTPVRFKCRRATANAITCAASTFAERRHSSPMSRWRAEVGYEPNQLRPAKADGEGRRLAICVRACG